MRETHRFQLDVNEITHRLENWYRTNKRALPWRFSAHSKKISRAQRGYYALVAEAMLQQTQVSRVIDRFRQFIKIYPNFNSLAEAQEQDILAQWQGLGYYRRAKNLHAASKIIALNFNSTVPDTINTLLSLPGVGRYTAGAIASIAYGKRVPLVDGNVKRVIARLSAYPHSTDDRAGENHIWQTAGLLVSKSNQPGQFNQALMELGSLICLPTENRAKCEHCPVRQQCAAFQSNRVAQIPKPKKPPIQKNIYAASIIIRNNRANWLMVKRPRRGLWASMWQVPTLEREKKSHINRTTIEQFIQNEIGYHIANNVSNKNTPTLTKINAFIHQTSHRRINFTVWELKQFQGRKKVGRWLNQKELQSHPISNAQRKILQIAQMYHD